MFSLFKCKLWDISSCSWTHLKRGVFGVTLVLNSATGMPRDATCAPNKAAGYTTEDVPTWETDRNTELTGLQTLQTAFSSLSRSAQKWLIFDLKLTTRQRSHVSSSFSTLVRMCESRVSPNQMTWGRSRPSQPFSSHLRQKHLTWAAGTDRDLRIISVIVMRKIWKTAV